VNWHAPAATRAETLVFALFGLEDALDRIDPCRQSYGVALDVRNQACRNEMMMAFVAALTAAVLGQLDLVALDMIDLADRRAFGVDDLHMLTDLIEAAHPASPSATMVNRPAGSETLLRAQRLRCWTGGTGVPKLRSLRCNNRSTGRTQYGGRS
jgi:hypothetical protein